MSTTSKYTREEAQARMDEITSECQGKMRECVRIADEHGIIWQPPNFGGYGNYTPEKAYREFEEKKKRFNELRKSATKTRKPGEYWDTYSWDDPALTAEYESLQVDIDTYREMGGSSDWYGWQTSSIC